MAKVIASCFILVMVASCVPSCDASRALRGTSDISAQEAADLHVTSRRLDTSNASNEISSTEHESATETTEVSAEQEDDLRLCETAEDSGSESGASDCQRVLIDYGASEFNHNAKRP